jgi:pimeloyl-ACP methyl ester carboxylesterase
VKPSRSEYLPIHNVNYHVRLWGEPAAPKLFLLHGWMDVSASFQFLVDALAREWLVIAPDWRGFGQSQWLGHSYYFPDYLADLDALLFHYQADAPVNLAGHSMGGNVASLYAGTRPERIRKLAVLEGFGLKGTQPEAAPRRFAKWLDELRDLPAFRAYANFDELAARLQQNNPRLSNDKAQFLARHWGRAADGAVVLASDPRHKLTHPVLYRVEEAKACLRDISAPTLWVLGADSGVVARQTDGEDDYQARKSCVRHLRETVLADCGHMMHHDQPQALAQLLETFFADS